MPNTPIPLSPSILNVGSSISADEVIKPVDLESSGASQAIRSINVTSISTPGGGSVRPTTGYMYPRGTG